MTSEPNDLEGALAAFALALQRDELLEATARLETTVRAPGSFEPVRRAEAAFEAAWPAGSRPTHELVWALPGASAGAALSLRAYDDCGRLLLARQHPEVGHG